MDQQKQTKAEEDQDKPAELSHKDLEQVAGGVADGVWYAAKCVNCGGRLPFCACL